MSTAEVSCFPAGGTLLFSASSTALCRGLQSWAVSGKSWSVFAPVPAKPLSRKKLHICKVNFCTFPTSLLIPGRNHREWEILVPSCGRCL